MEDWRRRGERDRRRERGRGEKKEIEMMTGEPYRHVVSTSAKPLTKTVRWLKMNGFENQ